MSPKAPLWTIPRIWDGTECFILGGGPSLNAVDVEQLRGRHVIAVNNAFKIAMWADAMFYGDLKWPTFGRPVPHGQLLLQFAGLKVTSVEKHEGKPGIKAVRRFGKSYGISRNPGYLTWNKSSGASAINLAVLLGAGRIVLLGYDMHKIGGECNWHQEHPNHNNPKKNPYEGFLEPFPAIARDLKAMGVECVNATPGSALTEFPIITPEEAIAGAVLAKAEGVAA